MYREIIPGLYLLKSKKPSSNSYLILGEKLKVLIDSGISQHFNFLTKDLKDIGVDTRSLNMIINTHEHVDHFGANRYLNMWTTLELTDISRKETPFLLIGMLPRKSYRQMMK